MKKLSWLTWLLVLMTAIFVGGCSSSDDGPSGPSGDNPPEFGGTDNVITVPQGMMNSQDPYAQMAVGYIQMANGVAGMGGWFEPPSGLRAADGPPWEYTWSDGDLTVTLIINETSTLYTWDVYLDGSDGYETYDDYHFYHAWEEKDGGCGGLEFFAPEEDGYIEWSWCTETDGTFTMNMYFTDGQSDFTIDVLVYANGSGEISFMVDDVTTLYVTWTSQGDGAWWSYDEEGDPTGNGTWDAAL